MSLTGLRTTSGAAAADAVAMADDSAASMALVQSIACRPAVVLREGKLAGKLLVNDLVGMLL